MKRFLNALNDFVILDHRRQWGLGLLFVLFCAIAFFVNRIDHLYDYPDLDQAQFIQWSESKNSSGSDTSEGQEDKHYLSYADDTPTENSELTFFDPNQVSVGQLESFGLPGYLAKRWVKYREKGGKFYKPEDIGKLYGLSEYHYRKLLPYVKMETGINRTNPTSALHKSEAPQVSGENVSPITVAKKREATLDLNIADSNQLVDIRGIGPGFAHRILRFRSALGGFHKLEQLYEVYDIDSNLVSDLMPQLVLGETPITKLNLNTCDLKTLSFHPYINYRQAKAIVAYREKHGAFKQVEDITLVGVINEAELSKVLPYLSVD